MIGKRWSLHLQQHNHVDVLTWRYFPHYEVFGVLLWTSQICCGSQVFCDLRRHDASGKSPLPRCPLWLTQNIARIIRDVRIWLWFSVDWYRTCVYAYPSGLLFIKRTDGLPQDYAKSRNREIHIYIFPIAMKFDRYLRSSINETTVEFQNDTTTITPILAASKLHETWRLDVLPLSE